MIDERAVTDISDDELLRRTVTSAKSRWRNGRTEWRWIVVMEMFGLGSTFAKQLCARFGLDPEKGV